MLEIASEKLTVSLPESPEVLCVAMADSPDVFDDVTACPGSNKSLRQGMGVRGGDHKVSLRFHGLASPSSCNIFVFLNSVPSEANGDSLGVSVRRDEMDRRDCWINYFRYCLEALMLGN